MDRDVRSTIANANVNYVVAVITTTTSGICPTGAYTLGVYVASDPHNSVARVEEEKC